MVLTARHCNAVAVAQDKTYCKQQKKTPVYDTGLLLFRDFVVRRFARSLLCAMMAGSLDS